MLQSWVQLITGEKESVLVHPKIMHEVKFFATTWTINQGMYHRIPAQNNVTSGQKS